MNTATIHFFTLPLKIFLDRVFFGSFFAPPIDFYEPKHLAWND